jgi:hypothetical protein
MLECASFSTRKKRISIELPKQMNQPGYRSSPPGLMTCAQPSSIITVEVFVKQNVITPAGKYSPAAC